jgi:hypothetical protein
LGVGKQLDTEALIRTLSNLSASVAPDAIRLHIPRALRVVYDIRNKRDAAHLADGIDPNFQDATLVIGILDWVMSEFIRLFHNVSANEAHKIIESLVTRQPPVIQDFGDHPKVLKPNLSASEHALVLLYRQGPQGATFLKLVDWVRPAMRPNLRRTLTRLVDERDLLHFDGSVYRITRLGELYVEQNGLLDPP